MSADPSQPSSKLVLIVDDDESMGEYMEFAVKKEGFRFDREANGQKALSRIAVQRPDAIVLDIMLPGIGGYELLRELQARGFGDIPIVVVTGRQMDAESVAMFQRESNVKEYLQKPIKPVVLAAALHRVLGTTPIHSPRNEGGGAAF